MNTNDVAYKFDFSHCRGIRTLNLFLLFRLEDDHQWSSMHEIQCWHSCYDVMKSPSFFIMMSISDLNWLLAPFFFSVSPILTTYQMIPSKSLVLPLVLASFYYFFYYIFDILIPFTVCPYVNSILVLCCGIGFLYIPNFSLSTWIGVFLFSYGFSNDMAFLSTKSWIISLNFWHSHVLCPWSLWYPQNPPIVLVFL